MVSSLLSLDGNSNSPQSKPVISYNGEMPYLSHVKIPHAHLNNTSVRPHYDLHFIQGIDGMKVVLERIDGAFMSDLLNTDSLECCCVYILNFIKSVGSYAIYIVSER